ncbi:cupin domain-containing protein [Halovulum marinum]|nr:cupin domain-containing protein [Halovulum marinum]
MNMARIKHFASTAVAVGALALAAAAPVGADEGQAHPKMVPVGQVTFQPGPATLPAGAQIAVLHGNPAEEGPFVIRLKFPAGYVIPPHSHTKEEHVTVISGGFGMGTGGTVDKAKAPIMASGSFVQIPVGMPHFAWTEEETVVQINAMGPFGITYVDPADDPRGT